MSLGLSALALRFGARRIQTLTADIQKAQADAEEFTANIASLDKPEGLAPQDSPGFTEDTRP